MTNIQLRFAAAVALLLCGAASVPAQAPQPARDTARAASDTLPRRLPAVTVTRDVGRSPLDLPYAVTTVTPDRVAPGQTHTLVDQTLALLPGFTVANRNNPSQDARISIRGFGARSPFGVRSIRVLRDGMPLTLPDGQTPIDYLDLESVGRVEAIRGSASALYGNASGGVVDLRSTAPVSAPVAVQARSWAGGFGMRRFVAMLGGTLGRTAYAGNAGRTQSDGDRAHARQRLSNAFVHAGTSVRDVELTLLGLGLDMPLAENPGALTRAQFDASPGSADPASVAKQARKTVRQVQIGLGARRALGADGEVLAQVYGGGRSLYNPLIFAIVGIDRRSEGASVRFTDARTIGPLRHRFTVGADAQRLSDARRNWANCNGVASPTANCASPGVEQGRLQLDQREVVTSVGPYVRDEVSAGSLRATVGLRADNITFRLRDAFLADGRDDSGTRRMRAVSPMAGLDVRLSPTQSVYGNVSSAFETPTTTELVNRADGSAGLNPDLRPQYATTYETGAKGFLHDRLRYDVALYSTTVRDELIPFDVGSGRTAFRNAGRTQRRGAEAWLAAESGPLTIVTAYTYSRFRFRDFVIGQTQLAGRTIPGIPAHQIQTTATARSGRGFAVAEWIAQSSVQVNDANAASAPGYAVLHLRLGLASAEGDGGGSGAWIAPVVGVQNVFDRKFAGSVAVNAAAGKFFEPGQRRRWVVGLRAGTGGW